MNLEFAGEVEDLRARLRRTRWPVDLGKTGWKYGIDADVLRDLVAYWRDRFDWQAQLARLHGGEHALVPVEGVPVEYWRIRSRERATMLPLLMLHGWPSSLFELVDVARRVVSTMDATDGAVGVEVVVASLPGFGLSRAPRGRDLTFSYAAAQLRRLMTDVLGHGRFYAHGGDFGANVVNRLGLSHGDVTAGMHVMTALYPGEVLVQGELAPEEHDFIQTAADWYETHGAYHHLQRRQPQVVGYALADSPVGLCAWIFEKFWSWCEFQDDLREVVSWDDLLTNVTWYWLTNSIHTANRYYADREREAFPANPRIGVPTRVFLTREKVDLCPRAWAERIYQRLEYCLASSGGHFLGWEQPQALGRDVAAWLLRSTSKPTQ